MTSFPDIGWFHAYARGLEKNEDFRTFCRWFKGDIAFRVDGQATTVGFDDGLVTGVREGMDGAQYVINGSAASWDRLLHHDVTLLRLYRAGEVEIRGKNTEIMKNWKALFWIAEGMKSVDAAGGRA